MLAGTGFEPIQQDYEPCELPLLNPAKYQYYTKKKMTKKKTE
jgi:hypothetical protein